MAWGTLTIGGVTFREETVADQTGAEVRLAGQEAHPPTTKAAVFAAHHNLSAMGRDNPVLPLIATDKAELSGFYQVTQAQSALDKVNEGSVITATWSATLTRLGGPNDLEFESRVPTVGRITDLAGPPSPVFWHAPAGGHDTYLTGTTVPSGSVTRQSADGALLVYTGIPAGVSPRWTVPAYFFLNGAARVLFDGLRRLGTLTPPLSVWEINNALVRVQPAASGGFTVSAWDADVGDWASAKSYQITVNGAAVTSSPEPTVLRNDPEEVMVRLTYPATPGRITVDLGLRRGARVVTGVLKRHSAATLGVTRTAAEAASAVTGGLRATSADADGNRFVMGSAKTPTTTLATASIAKASVLSLDFFLGHEVGSAPAAGDAFADLLAQYLGSAGEMVRVVGR